VVHDELVVLDTRTATYHALNPAASLIWAVLAEGGSQNAAVDALVTRFRITLERARVDVETTIRQLTERALLDPDAP
jgi:hypothetical protein